MSFGRLLLISLLIISISSLLVYFITPDIVNSIYTTKYQFQGKPELGYFIAVLETIILGLKDIRLTLIVSSTSILAGLLYLKKKSWIAGMFTYIILLILLLIFYYRFFNSLNIPDGLEFFINILFTLSIAGCISSIPGIAVYLIKRKPSEGIQMSRHEEPSTICPACGAKYDSKPLICIRCGFTVNPASNIRMGAERNCAN